MEQALPNRLHSQIRDLVAGLRASGSPTPAQAGVEGARERVALLRRSMPPGPDLDLVEDLVLPAEPPVPVRRYRRGDGAEGTVVYLHGGGWVTGGRDASDAFCRTLADQVPGWTVVSVDYRLAPDHRHPAAVEDARAAVRWASREHSASGRLVVLGDSAGGNLAAVVAGDPAPRVDLQILVYPVTDHRMQTPSYRVHSDALFIGAADMAWFWDQYLPDVAQRGRHDASPGLVRDLSGRPPAHVVIAEYDPLRDEGLDYARRLADAGVPVTVDIYERMAHGFLSLVGVLDTAGEAVASLAATIISPVAPTAGR